MSLFGEAHDAFRQRVRAYTETHLAPHAAEWDARGELPRSVFLELGQEGFLGPTRAPEVGGQGLDFGYDVVLAEELARSRMPGLTLSVLCQNNLVLPLLDSLATPAQKEQFLVPAVAGRAIGAVASTEPAGGSDIIRATQLRAHSEGDCWVLHGEKLYITNGPIADFVVTLARTREMASPTSFTFIIVPTDTPGFRIKEKLKKLGMHTSPTGWLELDHCRVPKSYTLGKSGVGYFYHTRNLLEERLVTGVCAASIAALVLEETMQYLRERVVYGQPLAQLQAVRHRLVDMATDVEMARRFVHSVCEAYRDGRVEAKEICMIKFRVIDILQQIVPQCLQLHGGAGFMEDNWITRVYRDMRMLSLGGGVSELMKDIIAGYLRL